MNNYEIIDIVLCARRLGVSPPTVRRWARTAGLPAKRIGQATLRFNWPEVFEWFNSLNSIPPEPMTKRRKGRKK